ncbi:penicillin acylase family protein [Aeromicrobium chenweiae]|uniref:Penicillin acylase family protein n=1 Tax=Aeromicrobium chenweiae TaxID=2079793 RepID=A0A2S0WJ53_9ACTN|nr:penicillin acylase family protein [Aeromicrobium chenweiae]AWB91371.1 penicillin acylase family protein [Aeromicrobium chenweiae]TGN30697.1 penicillin acylase family protein [Aeromicrobium chenweiae]
MSPVRRLLIVIAGLLSVLIVGVAIFSFVTVRKSFPDTKGEVQISGLKGEVEIKRDGKGIPQIYADTPEDLFLAQGYVHAQDRFYEMDFRRHVTSGRLAELVGDAALDTDKYVRTLGWRRVAEKEVALLDDSTLSLVKAYARGVNSYIDSRSGSELSLEYAVLGLTGPDYTPEPWSVVDSLAWIKAMAWDLRSNMTDEIDRVLATQKLTVAQVEELYPGFPENHHTIVGDEGTVQDGAFVDEAPTAAGLARTAVASLKKAKSSAEALPALLGIGDGIGSNSWVVAGDHTATGKPILANDPHLAPSMPGIWYQVGLHCRVVSKACPYDVAGFSFSGLPGVVVGHNAKIAWGVTTMYADVADLYLERVEGDTYEYDGKQVPLETRRETFKIAGEKSQTITVRSTRHGPILSDLDEDAEDVGESAQKTATRGSYEVALRWTALDPEPTIKAVFALGRAQDWDEFRAAAKLFTVPSQNLLYADVEGNIGYQSPGTIPIRKKGDGRWPVPGWDPSYGWKGSIPFDELPTVLNPDEGFIVTANNKVIGDQYPNLLGADTAAGYRSERIRDLLELRTQSPGQGKGLGVEDMSRIQNDTYSANAARLVPQLLKVDPGSRYYRQGQQTLTKWDFKQDADSPGAAYFNSVWRHLLKLTFQDELPEAVWPEGGERWFSVVSDILDRPGSHWWDNVSTPERETRDQILTQALRDARDELTMIQSRSPKQWRWGTMHKLELVNQTLGDSGIGLVNRLFNRGPYRVAGGSGIVNATSWDATEGYEVTAVPSMRMIVDLDDVDRSRWIQLTGASGHAFHDHYVDQQKLWSKGETLPWVFTPKAVDEATDDTLTLVPRGRA